MGSDGQIGGGWVQVVGYGSGWVEMGRSMVGGFGLWVMAMGRSVVVGGSASDGQIGGGRISDGESVVVPISVLICFCLCFFVLVVDSVVVVG